MEPANPRDETVSRRGVLLAGIAVAGSTVAAGSRATDSDQRMRTPPHASMLTHPPAIWSSRSPMVVMQTHAGYFVYPYGFF